MSLQIKLVNAVLSHDTQTFSNMDPYCILKLGQQTFRSKTKDQAGKRPVWNQSYTFDAQENSLKITVMDQDTASDDLVGEGTLDVSKFRNNPTEQQQLVQLYYSGKNAGKVQLLIKGTGTNTNINPNINNIGNNIIPGFGGQGNGWGQPNNQWGGNNPQFNPPPPNPNFAPNQLGMYQGMPNQSGNINPNNGWNNPYPPLENPTYNNNTNAMSLMGQFIGQQASYPNNQANLQGNVQTQFQMINGMGMLNKGNQNYGNNPYP